MKTARFLIAVASDTNTDIRLERVLRRADESRAVLCAQNWLAQLKRTEYMFNVTLTRYEVYRETDSGLWKAVEIGDVSNAEMGRNRARAKGKEAQEKAMDGAASRNKSGRTRKDGTAKSRVRAEPKATLRDIKPFRTAKNLSPFQQRLEQLKANARQTLEHKRACGESK